MQGKICSSKRLRSFPESGRLQKDGDVFLVVSKCVLDMIGLPICSVILPAGPILLLGPQKDGSGSAPSRLGT